MRFDQRTEEDEREPHEFVDVQFESSQTRATLPDGSQRYYDGLALKSDGTWEGIEVKSGNASRSGSQRAFDDAVGSGVPATAMLEGKPIQITSTYLQRVY
ncbi:MAG: hypothetical protein J0I78_17695 [Microbacterium sp.]|nr:hypothetical protein [Microbacterium sp.]OJU71911.1 MAG: hypothetical protein BGO04_00950 [Microbacterium sp. 70-38]